MEPKYSTTKPGPKRGLCRSWILRSLLPGGRVECKKRECAGGIQSRVELGRRSFGWWDKLCPFRLLSSLQRRLTAARFSTSYGEKALSEVCMHDNHASLSSSYIDREFTLILHALWLMVYTKCMVYKRSNGCFEDSVPGCLRYEHLCQRRERTRLICPRTGDNTAVPCGHVF